MDNVYAVVAVGVAFVAGGAGAAVGDIVVAGVEVEVGVAVAAQVVVGGRDGLVDSVRFEGHSLVAMGLADHGVDDVAVVDVVFDLEVFGEGGDGGVGFFGCGP